ncbi:ESF1 homolog isoform X2 [Hydra vulgaris]|uniref:ESF1 homolog isoform X2 n=1 Tax=Hydra vulgaris TaxID=6087 RepID=A0ABM4C2C4_HYDVU
MEVDKRFEKVKNDPRFQRISKKNKKIKIDPRFEKMFSDDRFHTKFSHDKRGKPILEEEKEDLHKFYDVQPDEESNDEEQTEKNDTENISSRFSCKTKTDVKSSLKKLPEEGNIKTPKAFNSSKKLAKPGNSKVSKVKFEDIRGENSLSETNSDSEDNFDDEVDDGLIHGWGDLDEDAKRVDNAETSRFAVCNCDWDKITATDLFVLFNSFKPSGGNIVSVNIYPSDYGIQRMKEEDLKGPQEIKELPNEDKEVEEGSEGSSFHMEKLREYQLNRMKYYYAVVVCDSKETADKIYCECDGMEFEMSATHLDLRFIPDHVTFDDREPKSTATELPNINSYAPAKFINTALQQSTVRLTWDETDTKRIEKTMRKFTKADIDEMDFKEYLASSSDEEDQIKKSDKTETSSDYSGSEEDDERIKKYRLLMKEIESKEEVEEDDGNIEVSWNQEVEEENHASISKETNKIKKITNNNNEPNNISDDKLSNDNKNLGFNDPFFKNKKKTKLKKKSKVNESITEEDLKNKAELELLLMDEEPEEKKHFSLKTILDQEKSSKKKKKKRNAEKQLDDTFEVDVKDPRFNALYTSHLYSIDPSEPQFKKTKGTTKIIAESQKRRGENINVSHETVGANFNKDTKKLDTCLSDLVNSVKTKTKLHQKKKKLK